MRISDWSSDVCSSDLEDVIEDSDVRQAAVPCAILEDRSGWSADTVHNHMRRVLRSHPPAFGNGQGIAGCERSEEHTSELQSLMRISYAVFCLKKKKKIQK